MIYCSFNQMKDGYLPFSRLLSSIGWQSIVVVPEKGQAQKTFRGLLEEYVASPSKLKQMHMTKQISWDFAQVTQMLHFLVRQAGYHHNVSITYPVVGQHCWVYSPSLISKVSHDKCLQCLTCITCTWIIFVPLYYAFRQKASNKIVADYPCSISPQDFYLRNYWNSKCKISKTKSLTVFLPLVLHHVQNRSQGQFAAL